MKTTVLLILASISLSALTASAHEECHERRIVGHTRCGEPIFATLEIVGRSRCGEPVFEWVTHYPRETYRRDFDDERHEEFHHHHYDRR